MTSRREVGRSCTCSKHTSNITRTSTPPPTLGSSCTGSGAAAATTRHRFSRSRSRSNTIPTPARCSTEAEEVTTASPAGGTIAAPHPRGCPTQIPISTIPPIGGREVMEGNPLTPPHRRLPPCSRTTSGGRFCRRGGRRRPGWQRRPSPSPSRCPCPCPCPCRCNVVITRKTLLRKRLNPESVVKARPNPKIYPPEICLLEDPGR